MTGIKHVFFDLDHTIWDFDKNSAEALKDIFYEMQLDKEIKSLDEFTSVYRKINAKYWNLYNHGKVTKAQVRTERFNKTLTHFKVKEVTKKAEILGEKYINTSPHKTNIFPNTHSTLTYLKEKYKLHIITNGFTEVQFIKLANCNLTDYFEMILCTEEVGVNKPNPLVFETALHKTGAISSESVMIGDNPETDIMGAKNCGFQTILFNPHQVKIDIQSTEIQDLKELVTLL